MAPSKHHTWQVGDPTKLPEKVGTETDPRWQIGETIPFRRVIMTPEQIKRWEALTAAALTRAGKPSLKRPRNRAKEDEIAAALKAAGLTVAGKPSVKRSRSFAKEDKQAQRSLFDDLMKVKIELDGNPAPAIVQVAQALVTCGMPYRMTQERSITRRSRMSDGTTLSVTFSAVDPDVPLPYGADRTLLYWLIDLAIKRQQPFIPWESSADYMRDIGLSDGGANYAKVRDAFNRISACAITVIRTKDDDKERAILPIIDASRLPQNMKAEGKQGVQRGVEFSPRFFEEIVSRHVPFPWHMLRAVDRRPQMQDIIIFLYWRIYAARSETLITWAQLREQLWYEDSNPRRIRQRFAEAIKAMQLVWPFIRVEARSEGLWIEPLRAGHLLLQGVPDQP